MDPFYLLVVVVAMVNTPAYVSGQAPEVRPLDEKCFECLCNALTGCNLTLACENNACGPYRISRPYWLDAKQPLKEGQPVKGPSSYADCTNDKECSERTISAYMERYKTDCTDDGEINCVDYVLIHSLGPFSCNGSVNQQFYFKFAKCYNQISAQDSEGIIVPRAKIDARISLFRAPKTTEEPER